MKYNILATDSVTELTMERVRLAMMQAAQAVFDEDLGRSKIIDMLNELLGKDMIQKIILR